MRRPAPRPLALALDGVTRRASPPTVLARVQAVWPDVVGKAVAAEAFPTAERAGQLVVTCRSATWAQELSLAGPEFVQRLNEVLEPAGPGPLKELRPRAAGAAETLPGRRGTRFP